MTDILKEGAPVLRSKASAVSLSDIGSRELDGILARMKEALDSQPDGVAIAAPQIGVPLRIFMVAGFMFKKNKDTVPPPGRVFINPEITTLSKEKIWMEEGCLSVRFLYGEVSRAKKAKIRAYDEHGKSFTLGGTGILAQIFQHETDHLEGVLFIDKAKNLHEMPPEEREALLKNVSTLR